MDKTFNDVITEVNKNGRSRELSVEEAIRWLCLKICAQVIYHTCNPRALFYNFEWLHASTCLTSNVASLLIDESRNTMGLKKEMILTASALAG
eukprot:323707_1